MPSTGSPRGVKIENAVRIKPELDVRGEGGYVVVAPSVIDGKIYDWRWKGGWDDLPEWGGIQPEKKRQGNLVAFNLDQVQPAITPTTEMAKGGRNNALASIAGQYAAKGLDQGEVLALCKIWNSTHCQPPLGESELVTTVNSICSRHAVNHPPVVAPPNVRPAPIPKPCDEAFPEHLLNPDGILGQIMEYTEQTSAASVPMFNLAGAIALLGTRGRTAGDDRNRAQDQLLQHMPGLPRHRQGCAAEGDPGTARQERGTKCPGAQRLDKWCGVIESPVLG